MAKKSNIPFLTNVSDEIKAAGAAFVEAKTAEADAKAAQAVHGEVLREFGREQLAGYGVLRFATDDDDNAVEFQAKTPPLKTLGYSSEEDVNAVFGDKAGLYTVQATKGVRFEINVDPTDLAATLGLVTSALQEAGLDASEMISVVYDKDISPSDTLKASLKAGTLATEIGTANAEKAKRMFGWEDQPRTALRVVATSKAKKDAGNGNGDTATTVTPDLGDQLAALGLGGAKKPNGKKKASRKVAKKKAAKK